MPKKIDEQEIHQMIVEEAYCSEHAPLTICVLTLLSGFKVVGTSSTIDPDAYDEALGQEIAKKRAIDQVWAHEAYYRMRLAE